MKTFVALFRGINVGGHNKLPMNELVEILEGLGLQKITTYIQSGNIVFDSEEAGKKTLSDQIREAIHQSQGFAPEVVLLRSEELEDAIVANPYPEAEGEPKTLHLYFLGSEPENPDIKRIEEVKQDNERYALVGKVFYLHAPDGIGRSKLAAGVEKALGVSATARNWRTVSKIREMTKR